MDAKKTLALTFVAFAIVAVTWSLRTDYRDSEIPPVTVPPAAGNQLTTRSGPIRTVEDEMAALPQSTAQPADVPAGNAQQSLEAEFKALQMQLNNSKAKADEIASIRRQREFEKLVAAGFAPDRIEWIRSRSDQLQEQWRRDQLERRRQGLPMDASQEATHYNDRDVALRNEMGDDEYTRYRLALGRPAGVAVAAVAQGSPAGSAGLLPGDDVVNYGGARVFSLAELNALASRRNSGDSVLIDVLRNGQTIQLVVPGGPLHLETKLPLPTSGMAQSP